MLLEGLSYFAPHSLIAVDLFHSPVSSFERGPMTACSEVELVGFVVVAEAEASTEVLLEEGLL